MRTVAKLALIALIFSVFQALPVSAAGPPQAHMERFIVVLEDGVDPYGLANKATETLVKKGQLTQSSVNTLNMHLQEYRSQQRQAANAQ